VGLMDEQWAVREPLVEACRPHARVPPSKLQRAVTAPQFAPIRGALVKRLAAPDPAPLDAPGMSWGPSK